MNDPNGLIYYQGSYYVFYQWNRFALDHSYKEWGLYRTTDWVTWTDHGSALLPDQDYDLQGIYSGSGYEINGQLFLYYTGNSKENGSRKSSQCLAVSDNGRTFLKKGPILETPEGYTEHFRDPKVFQGISGQYFMVVGGQKESGSGAIALCHSADGQRWKYQIDLANANQYQMVECPDLIRLTEQDILIYCLQERNNETDEGIESFAAYQAGKFDESDGTFSQTNLDQDFRILDYGFDFYAPQTFCDNQGRHILLAWMSNMDGEQEKAYGSGCNSVHCMTMPREIGWHNNQLYQQPLQEMYRLLGAQISGYTKGNDLIFPLSTRTFYLKASILVGQSEILFQILDNECTIAWNSDSKMLKLSRINWLTSEYEEKCCAVEDLRSIEIWYDTASIELFINHGEAVLSARIKPGLNSGELVINGLCMDHINVTQVTSFKKQGEDENE